MPDFGAHLTSFTSLRDLSISQDCIASLSIDRKPLPAHAILPSQLERLILCQRGLLVLQDEHEILFQEALAEWLDEMLESKELHFPKLREVVIWPWKPALLNEEEAQLAFKELEQLWERVHV